MDRDSRQRVGEVWVSDRGDDCAGMIYLCKAWLFVFSVMLWAVFQVPASI